MEKNYTEVLESIKRNLIKEYGEHMTVVGMDKLIEKAMVHYNAVMTMYGQDERRDRITIIIKPEKFDSDMLMSIEDNWNEFVVDELGLDPCDAIMITPF